MLVLYKAGDQIRTFLYSTITHLQASFISMDQNYFLACEFLFEGIYLSIYLPRSINWRIILYCCKKSNMVSSKLVFGNESQTYTNFCQTTFDQLKRILSGWKSEKKFESLNLLSDSLFTTF